jgi:hypothetical protein
MKKNFSFNLNTNFSINGKNILSNKVNDEKDLTPQQEYWLNRFLRNYAGKIFWMFILFFVFIFGIIFFTANSDNVSTKKSIDINISR